MAELPSSVDVVVVGAGLAGLRASAILQDAGLDAVVLERDSRPGGRVRTDVVDGLLLDRGFQLYNPSYPEARRALDHEALGLRPFTAGAAVAHAGGLTRLADPRRKPAWAWESARAPFGSMGDRTRLASYAWSAARSSAGALGERPDVSAAEALAAAGIAPAVVDAVLRPFLAGVFLERELSTSRRFLDLVLRSFVRGTPCVPSAGMGAIPDQLASQLEPHTVVTDVEVLGVGPRGVHTTEGEVRARAVVLATDGATAADLEPALRRPDFQSVTTWYHVADCVPSDLLDGDPVLVVDAESRGPLVNAVVMTNAAPTYASDGRVLVSSSTLGVAAGADDERRVREHLALMYGVPTRGWEHVATYPIRHALPAMLPPLLVKQEPRLGDHLYVCGDHRATASIQGALVSGRHAAEAVIADLGARNGRA